MPSTVPNSPMNGALLPIVPSTASRASSRERVRALALSIASPQAWAPRLTAARPAATTTHSIASEPATNCQALFKSPAQKVVPAWPPDRPTSTLCSMKYQSRSTMIPTLTKLSMTST